MSAKPVVLFGEERVRERVAALGREIGVEYAGREICVVGLIKSSLVFMADLIRAIPSELTCHLLRVRQAGPGGASPHELVYVSEIPYEGRDVLLIDDVLDTGITLNFILDHIRDRSPRSLRTCVLIDKPGERKAEVRPDWTAFTLEEGLDGFLVGYGLDYQERYRGLPYIGTIPKPAAVAGSQS
jgi:hypoxanthine phosphoribosyltransferase